MFTRPSFRSSYCPYVSKIVSLTYPPIAPLTYETSFLCLSEFIWKSGVWEHKPVREDIALPNGRRTIYLPGNNISTWTPSLYVWESRSRQDVFSLACSFFHGIGSGFLELFKLVSVVYFSPLHLRRFLMPHWMLATTTWQNDVDFPLGFVGFFVVCSQIW